MAILIFTINFARRKMWKSLPVEGKQALATMTFFLFFFFLFFMFLFVLLRGDDDVIYTVVMFKKLQAQRAVRSLAWRR
ncbi:hypothetical protein CRG98_027246 [Punica granatum]|uniref:Uncharacterized protein n=1 Tax=Punica granatum TaxID=22663 RepID=A0A2I0J8V4_PUNGR|nr:hypothetical protein CRG98_027246 [Punica granatum]